ncbi:MAG TPA: HEAT repeat domain-containing protein [Bryobacteraceae bacterium]|nr:HEAT repeat domain-containing protein [Bryobacteraceae bacterium]
MQKEPGLLEKYIADIARALEGFSEHEADSKRVLDQLCASDPVKFFAAGIHVVAALEFSPASHYLVLLLAKDKRLSNWLLDTKLCTLKVAVAVARAAADARIQLQSTFEMALNKGLQRQASSANTDRILRILNLLEAIGSQSCWDSFQVELMAYPDKVVRSKAALLIGRSQKNTDWIVRRLLDRDPRVQANAVETLWGLDAAEAKPHLLEALKSKHNRVFANAALGLYRLGDPSVIHVLLEATRHEDPLFQISALWAIGQTQDPRFLPALSLQFKSAQGRLRLALAGAMSRIRQREKSRVQANQLQLAISQGVVEPDGRRRLTLAVSSRPAKNLVSLKPTEFLLWENETPVENYEVRPAAPAEVILAGFIAPWFEAAGDPTEKTWREGLDRCLLMKRKDDLWRIDRYAAAAPEVPTGETDSSDSMPYEDSALAPQFKAAQCWIAEPDQLRKLVSLAVPRARAANTALAAIQRQCKTMTHPHGRRHVFILLHGTAGLDQKSAVDLLPGLAQDQAVTFHGIAARAAGQWTLFREFCVSMPEGTFTEVDPAEIADGIAGAYASLCNRFEINYAAPAATNSGGREPRVKLRVESSRGNGQAEITLERPPETSAEIPAEAPPVAAEVPAA